MLLEVEAADHEVDCSVCLLDDVQLEVHEVLVLLEPSEVELEVEVLQEALPVVSTLELEVEAPLEMVEVFLEVVE